MPTYVTGCQAYVRFEISLCRLWYFWTERWLQTLILKEMIVSKKVYRNARCSTDKFATADSWNSYVSVITDYSAFSLATVCLPTKNFNPIRNSLNLQPYACSSASIYTFDQQQQSLSALCIDSWCLNQAGKLCMHLVAPLSNYNIMLQAKCWTWLLTSVFSQKGCPGWDREGGRVICRSQSTSWAWHLEGTSPPNHSITQLGTSAHTCAWRWGTRLAVCAGSTDSLRSMTSTGRSENLGPPLFTINPWIKNHSCANCSLS